MTYWLMEKFDVTLTLNWRGDRTSTLMWRWNYVDCLTGLAYTFHNFKTTYLYLSYVGCLSGIYQQFKYLQTTIICVFLKEKKQELILLEYKCFMLRYYNFKFWECQLLFQLRLEFLSKFSHQFNLPNFDSPLDLPILDHNLIV